MSTNALRIRTLFVLFGCSLMLSACKEDSSSEPSSPAQASSPASGAASSASEKMAALEASGSLPILDRSDFLKGPDLNNNGIRDDIDAYISSRNYGELQKKAVEQNARALQSTLLVNLSDQAALNQTQAALEGSIDCVMTRFPGPSGAIVYSLEKITANTKPRLKAYLAFNKAMNGTMGSKLSTSTCE